MWRNEKERAVGAFFIRLFVTLACFSCLALIPWEGSAPISLGQEAFRYIALFVALVIWFIPLGRIRRVP